MVTKGHGRKEDHNVDDVDVERIEVIDDVGVSEERNDEAVHNGFPGRTNDVSGNCVLRRTKRRRRNVDECDEC